MQKRKIKNNGQHIFFFLTNSCTVKQQFLYFVCPPLAAITAAILLDMLSGSVYPGCLTKHFNRLGVWPPQSLDLNPIEQVWDILGNKVQEKKPRNLQELGEKARGRVENN